MAPHYIRPYTDELRDVCSQPTPSPSVRVQSPTHDKIAPSHIKPVATRCSPLFRETKQRTQSDPTVLLNSTHSSLAWPQLRKSHRNLLLAFWNESEHSQGWGIQMKQLTVSSRRRKHEAELNSISGLFFTSQLFKIWQPLDRFTGCINCCVMCSEPQYESKIMDDIIQDVIQL